MKHLRYQGKAIKVYDTKKKKLGSKYSLKKYKTQLIDGNKSSTRKIIRQSKNKLQGKPYVSKASDVNGPSSLIFLVYSSSLAENAFFLPTSCSNSLASS